MVTQTQLLLRRRSLLSRLCLDRGGMTTSSALLEVLLRSSATTNLATASTSSITARGQHLLASSDAAETACIACSLCTLACPACVLRLAGAVMCLRQIEGQIRGNIFVRGFLSSIPVVDLLQKRWENMPFSSFLAGALWLSRTARNICFRSQSAKKCFGKVTLKLR